MISILTLIFALNAWNPANGNLDSEIDFDTRIKGITMVAPPNPFEKDPIPPLKEVNATWISLVPYGFNRPGDPIVHYDAHWQWWGEKSQGITESIRLAHNEGMHVMLKPQVYIHGGWVGEMDFEKEADWETWENTYRNFILNFLRIAIEEKVELFCVGTEYKISVQKREKFWRSLIEEIRAEYTGKLVYSANWDSYSAMPFWDTMDYIGVSSYFPLSEKPTPVQSELLNAWKPIARKLKRFSNRKKKPILFTEFGYLTVDGCADKSWLLEQQIHELQRNELAQANSLDALFSSFYQEKWWHGGFLWKWFPNMEGHEGYPEKDYTIQGKLSQTVLAGWYNRIQ